MNSVPASTAPAQLTFDFNAPPYGYCRCGCGKETRLIDANDPKRGRIKGQPQRFIRGHQGLSRKSVRERLVEGSRYVGECRLYEHDTCQGGYGRISILGKRHLAHRASWEMEHGPIPDGMEVLHNCPDGDNPACWHPGHLFLGTQADNMHDMMAKGRAATGLKHGTHTKPETRRHGSTNGFAKLSEATIREIRREYIPYVMGTPRLARKYGVSQSCVWDIVQRKRWKHVE